MGTEGRILGVDVGDVRIGIAVSDPLGIIAQPHEVIQCSSPDRDVQAVRDIAERQGAIHIVVGLPLDQNGEVGPQAQRVLAFVERLRAAVSVEVATQDERFTTAAAERALIALNVRRKRRKKVIDKVAAQHILQTYLDRQANERARARRR